MSHNLKEKIKRDNSLINFLKIPEELIGEKNNRKKLEQFDEEIFCYLTEEKNKDYYKSHFKEILRNIYYIAKPAISRRILIILRKKYLFFQRKNEFPSWPIDLTLYDIYRNGIEEIFKISGFNELPFINFWPHEKKFAFVLTHDIETAAGQKNIWRLKEIEEELGFRSSFNFVPEKYKLDEELIQDLKNSGFEVGIHGLKHDGKLFKNSEVFLNRVSKINFYINKYKSLGFRSPLAWRNYEYMQRLNIKYDLSYFDSDVFEIQAGGCLSFHPFFLGKFIELPYTLPQDHTLYFLLDEKDDKIWERKMKIIRQFHGMALMLVHPDYILENNIINIYKKFLMKIKRDGDYWHALPKDIAEWWRSRANCVLRKIDDQWKIYPPLKGASIGKIKLKDGKIIFS